MTSKRSLSTLLAAASVSLLSIAGCSASPDSPNGGSGGAGGSGGTGGSSAPLTETTGCEPSVSLYASPDDPSVSGPWPVGVKEVTLGGFPGQVYYPAEIGSEVGKEKVSYHPMEVIPADIQSQLLYESPPVLTGDAYSDLPIDSAHGKYPVVLYVEGRYGVSYEGLSHFVHWASRGFVVVTVDLPALQMVDALKGQYVLQVYDDMAGVAGSVKSQSGDVAFLSGHVDTTRFGIVSRQYHVDYLHIPVPESKVIIEVQPECDAAQDAVPNDSIVVIANKADPWYATRERTCYDIAKSGRKRLVAIEGTMGVLLNDLCWVQDPQGHGFTEAVEPYSGAAKQDAYHDCTCAKSFPREDYDSILNFTTTAALEEALFCKTADLWGGIQGKFPHITEYEQSP